MRNNRRGISSVVGAMFMIIVMVGALGTVTWVLNEQDRISVAVNEKTNESLGRLNERIEITNIGVNSNKLNMTVTNVGGQPTKLASLYVVNETASPKTQYRYDLSDTVHGRGSLANVGQSTSLKVKSDTLYSVRLITESGNSVAAKLGPASSTKLAMTLTVIPPTVTPKQNVTLLFSVTNNSTDTFLNNATPTISTNPCGSCTLTLMEAPSKANIAKGATALFQWIYYIDGPTGTTSTFTASLAGAPAGNSATGKVRLEPVSFSGASDRIIGDVLIQRPGIFLTVPGPFGDANQKGFWAVTVANPTENPIEVSRVVVTLFSPKAGGSQQMFKEGVGCPITAIEPPSAGEWSCIQDNILEWRDTNNPEVIPPVSSKSFRAALPPGDIQNSDEPAFQVVATVFTSLGQFSSTGFSSNMGITTSPVANVYLTNTINADTTGTGALNTANMLANKNGVNEGSTVTFYVAIADFETSSSNYVKYGTKLIVNVPRDWESVTPTSWVGFTNNPTVTLFPDKSTQIVATLAGPPTSENLGDVNQAEGKVLRFTAVAPPVDEDTIFIMHMLMDGEADDNFSVGAFAQIPIQVLAT